MAPATEPVNPGAEFAGVGHRLNEDTGPIEEFLSHEAEPVFERFVSVVVPVHPGTTSSGLHRWILEQQAISRQEEGAALTLEQLAPANVQGGSPMTSEVAGACTFAMSLAIPSRTDWPGVVLRDYNGGRDATAQLYGEMSGSLARLEVDLDRFEEARPIADALMTYLMSQTSAGNPSRAAGDFEIVGVAGTMLAGRSIEDRLVAACLDDVPEDHGGALMLEAKRVSGNELLARWGAFMSQD